MKTATLRHEPAYFNRVAYANIPESVTIFPSGLAPKMKCEDADDAFDVAARHGITLVGAYAEAHHADIERQILSLDRSLGNAESAQDFKRAERVAAQMAKLQKRLDVVEFDLNPGGA